MQRGCPSNFKYELIELAAEDCYSMRAPQTKLFTIKVVYPFMASQKDVTQLLAAWSGGDKGALDQLMPLVYDELRRLADSYLRRERNDHTLQPTALVHEAYMRLVNEHSMTWQSRAHFFGVAAQMMRYLLVNHARDRTREKRGGKRRKLSLDDAVNLFEDREMDLLALDDALTTLAKLDEQQSRIIELRFFGGLTIEETAEVLNVSLSTIKREWNMAKSWLYQELKGIDV
jgi:RNA polymerase sigma-70 factor (ECF subfamily)